MKRQLFLDACTLNDKDILRNGILSPKTDFALEDRLLGFSRLVDPSAGDRFS